MVALYLYRTKPLNLTILRRPAALLLLVLPFFTFGQDASFEPAYYLDTNGRRVEGEVLFSGDPVAISQGIVFRPSGATATIDLRPDEIDEVGLTDMPTEMYRPVPYTTRNTDGERSVAERLARVLVAGPASLLILELPPNSYPRPFAESVNKLFFVTKGDERYPLERIITQRYSSTFEDDRYRSVLAVALADGDVPKRRIDRVPYDRYSLTELIRQYNQVKRSGVAADSLSATEVTEAYRPNRAKLFGAEIGLYGGVLTSGDETGGNAVGASLLLYLRARSVPGLRFGIGGSLGSVSGQRDAVSPSASEFTYTGTNTALFLTGGYTIPTGSRLSPYLGLRYTGLFTFYKTGGLVPGGTVRNRERRNSFGLEGGLRLERLSLVARLEPLATFADGGAAIEVRYRL